MSYYAYLEYGRKSCIKKRKRKNRVIAYFSRVSSGGVTVEGVITNMEIREDQAVKVTAVLKTKEGHPASYQKGSAQWSISDETVASLTLDDSDELSAVIKCTDGSNNTAFVVSLSVDGDPDDDNARPIVLTGDLVATQGEAVVGELSFGTPVDTE